MTPFTFWDIPSDIYEMFVYKHTETMEYELSELSE